MRRDNLAFVGFGEDGLGLPPARSGVVTPVTAHTVLRGDIWRHVLDTQAPWNGTCRLRHRALSTPRSSALVFVPWLPAAEVRVVKRMVRRAGASAALVATLCLATGCPFHKSGTTGTDGTTKTDSSSSMHPLGGGWVSQPRGLLDGLFDRNRAQSSGSSESEDHLNRKSQEPLVNELRNAYGAGRQGYEEPMPQAHAPRAPRPTFHAPRPSRRY